MNFARIVILISFAVITADLSAQTERYASFVIDSGEVVWAKVFEQPNATANELKEKMMAHISLNSAVKQIEANGSSITARVENYTIDYERFNISRFNAPPLISSAKWFGMLKIDFKDERYRVVLYRMKYFIYHDDKHIQGKGAPPVSKQSRMLTDEVVKRDESGFRRSYTQLLHVMHVSFIDSFMLRNADVQVPPVVYSQDW